MNDTSQAGSGTRFKQSHSAIVAQIGKDVIRGIYTAGEILPREEEFSDLLKVGRGVVREALRVLASKGLVESRPKRGTMVLPTAHWHLLDPDVLSWRAPVEMDGRFLRDVTDLRMMIEPVACAQAAERANDTELKLIASLARELKHNEGDETAFIEADMQFHRAVLTATHNELLIQVSAAIDAGLRLSREVTVSIGHGSRVEEHIKIADAIAARAAGKARRGMSELIEQTVSDITAVLGDSWFDLRA